MDRRPVQGRVAAADRLLQGTLQTVARQPANLLAKKCPEKRGHASPALRKLDCNPFLSRFPQARTLMSMGQLVHWLRRHITIEELANAITHGVGLALSIVGFVVLLVLAALRGTPWHIVSC